MKSFLQTNEWLEFQKEAGHRVWKFDNGKIQANIIKLGLPFGKSFLYIPHGPEIHFDDIRGGLQNELANFIKFLKDLARQEKSIFIKFEPASDIIVELLYKRGFKLSQKQIQPYKSVVLNLNLSEEDLLSRMHQKTRYNIKVAEKHGIEIKQNHDIQEFWKLLQKTTKRDRFSSHPKEYYKKLIDFLGDRGQVKTNIFLGYNGDKAIAGAIVLRYGDTGYYLHGASDYKYRSMMAPYALHWDIIKYLKNDGIKFYDFWGIDPRKWPGVTRFKLGWGGDLKEYPGSFDLPVSNLWCWLYKIARRIF